MKSKKLLPEYIVTSYINLLVSKRKFELNQYRIWTLILIPLWIITLFIGGFFFMKGISENGEISNLKKEISHDEQMISFAHKELNSVNRKLWPDKQEFSAGVLENTIEISKKNISKNSVLIDLLDENKWINFYLLPVLVFVIFFLPIIIARLAHWVKAVE